MGVLNSFKPPLMSLFYHPSFKVNAKLFFALLLITFVQPVKAQVLINEIQSSNLNTITDEYLQYDDWIELYNASASSVNLNGYGLSDDSTISFRFTFPDVSIASHGYMLVFASDTDKTSVNTHWETAVYENDTWKYRVNTTAPPDTNWRNNSFNDASWTSGIGGIGLGDGDDGTTVATCISVYTRRTFTIADTSKIFESVLNVDYDDGFVAYLNGVEIARVNTGSVGVRPSWNDLAQVSHEANMYQGLSPDSFYLSKKVLRSLLRNGSNVLALEVHNNTSTSTDLSGRVWLSFLVDNSVSYFGSIPTWFHPAPKQYLHAKFKLNRAGETVFLVDPSGTLADKKACGALEPDNSIGRNPDGSSTWCVAAVPTPGATNNSATCKNGYATIPLFSIPAGFYASTQTLVLSTSYPTGEIRYSLDGSDVADTSTLYTGPITLSSTKTVKARVFASTALPSQTITNTYLINLDCKLPVYSFATDPKNLWDYNTGIFVAGPNAQTAMPHFGANYWMDWEKPMSLEFFDRDKIRVFKFNSGLKITGGWSRTADQKSLEVSLSDKYGLSKLNYPIESDKPWNDKWDDFILHTTGNDRGVCHMRDPMMERLLKPTHIDYIAYEPCLLYINGQSWGVYYSRENDDHHWIEGNYGYSKNEIDLLKESYFYPTIEIKKGNDVAFWTMYNYAMNTTPTDAAYYSTMNTMMDLENMVDYFAAETYYPNDDWMGGNNNNLKMWRPTKSGGRFRYLSYDLDFGMGLVGSVTNNMLATALNPSPHNYNSDMFQRLVQNPTFKRYFINRYADLMNTIWLPSNVQSMAYLFRDSLRHDMHFQYDRWGGGDTNNWISNIATMMTFATNRPSNARGFVQSNFSLAGQVTLTLQVSPAGAGRIQISTITPTSYPWNGVYFNGNPVTITAIPNPGYTFDHWRSTGAISSNDLNQSTTYNFTANDVITCYFTGAAATAQVVISEVNYNSDSITNPGDWIEFYNPGSFALDISGWKFRDGADNHTFIFPAQTRISAGGYLVVASDLTKFNTIFPAVTNVVGSLGFDFDNGGEDLRLFDYNDALFTSVLYDDISPWPLTPDGLGYTLERVFPVTDPNDPASWFAGCRLGSPGKAYSIPTVSVGASGSLSICPGGSVTLNATAGSGTTFQWQRNHADISGATAASYNASQAGTYTVVVSSGTCSVLSDSLVVSEQAASQVTSTTPGSRCGSGTVVLSAAGTAALEWYTAATGGILAGSGSTLTTPSISQTTTYYVQAGGACPSTRTPVDATILTVAAAPVTQDVSRCGTGTVLLTASDTATIRWYSASTGGTLLATGTSYTTPVLSQSTTYYVEAGSVCPSARVPVTAVIASATATPVATGASRCGAGTLTLTATDTATIYWYSAASGGTLLATGPSFTTPVLTQTTTYYVEAGAFCVSSRVSVQAVVNATAAAPVTQDASRCGTGTVVLTASDTATVRWYAAASGGTLLGTGASFTTPSISVTTTYYAEAGSLCPSARIPAQAIINIAAAQPVTTDGNRCGPGSVTLTATDTATVRWYNAPGGGTLLFTGDVFVTPSLSITTAYYAEAGLVCPSTRVQVNAVINPVTADPTVQSGSRCGSGTVVLTATSTATINWYSSPGGTLLGTGASFTTPAISSTTTYYAQAGTTCPSAAVAVQAIVNAVAAAPVTQNANRCGAGTVTLTATDTAAIRWYAAASGGSQIGSGTSFTTPTLSVTTTYYAEAGSVCPSARVSAMAVINAITATPVASDVARCGPGTVTLTAMDTAAIHWYSAASGGTLLSTGPTFTTPSLTTTTAYFVEAGVTCPSPRIQVNAVISTAASDPVVQNASRCGTGTLVLTATSSFTVNWYSSPGGTLLGTGTSFTTPSISTTTTFYAQASAATCQSNFVAAQAIVNTVAAAPVTQNASRCGTGTLVLTASDTASIRWYSASSGGTLLGTGTSFTTPSITVTTTYYAEAGVVCPSSRVAAIAIINAVTPDPVVQSASRCGTGTVVLTATSSSTVNWYNTPGGTLLGTGTSFTTPSISSTTTYYAQAGTTCPSNTIAVQAIVNRVAAAPVTQNANRCGTGAVILTATDTASIRWYGVVTGGTQIGSGTSFTTPSLSVTTTYYAEAGSVCPSARVPATAIINAITAAPATSDVARCGPGTVTLTATDTAVIHWYSAASGGTLLATGPTYTTPTITTTTAYFVEAGTTCPSARIQVNAVISTAAADPIVQNASRCGTGSLVLTATSSFTVNWYSSPGGTLLGTGTSFTTPSISSTTTYYAQASASSCQSNFVAAQAVVNAVTTSPVTQSASRCGNGSLVLMATDTASMRWYDAPLNGAQVGTGASFTTPSLTSTTTYYVEAGTLCPSPRVPVQAIIYPVTADPIAPSVARCGPGTVTLTAADTAIVHWYDAAVGGTLVGTGPSLTTPSLTVTTSYFVEAGTLCPSNRIQVSAIITTAASDPVVQDASRCGDGSVTLTAVCPFSVSWYDSPGGTLVGTGLSFTTPVLTSSNTYYAQSGTGSCLSQFVAANAVINAITADPVISGASRCGTGSVTLIAMDTAAVFWYDSPGGTVVNTGATFLTPSLSQTTTFYVQAGTVCPTSLFDVTAIINPVTADPVTNDVTHCGPGAVTLTASDTAQIYWYDQPIGGATLGTGSSFTTPVLSASTVYYVQAVGLCPSNIVAVNVFIADFTADPLVTSSSNCGPGAILLSATDTAQIFWYDASSGGNLLATGSSYTTPVLSATTTYYVQAGTVCPSQMIPVDAIVNPVTSDPIVSGASNCGPGALTLSASDTASIFWYDAPTGGALLGTGASFVTPVLSGTTTYYVVAGTFCPSAAVPVVAEILTVPVLELGNDTILTTGTSLVLDAGAGFAAYAWNTLETTSSITVDTTGLYAVTVTATNGCSASDQINVTILTGMHDSASELNVSLYPNPVHNEFSLRFPSSWKDGVVKVFDASGKLFLLKELHEGMNQLLRISVEDWARGIYFVTVQEKDNRQLLRIVLQ